MEAWNNIEIYLQLIVNIRPLQLSKNFTFHCVEIYPFCKSVIFKSLESSSTSKMKPQMHTIHLSYGENPANLNQVKQSVLERISNSIQDSSNITPSVVHFKAQLKL